jgi:large conductance mechanosensitive channel
MLKGFRDFIMRGNIVDLAVAVVIGVAFGALVNSLVVDLLTPLIAAMVGKPDFSALTFTVNQSTFAYGKFINALLSFLMIGATVYFAIVQPMAALQRRRQRGAVEEVPAKPEEVQLLVQIRDLLQRPHDLPQQPQADIYRGPKDQPHLILTEQGWARGQTAIEWQWSPLACPKWAVQAMEALDEAIASEITNCVGETFEQLDELFVSLRE